MFKSFLVYTAMFAAFVAAMTAVIGGDYWRWHTNAVEICLPHKGVKETHFWDATVTCRDGKERVVRW